MATGNRSRAQKQSHLGALRRMKSLRRAARLQSQYASRLEAQNDRVQAAIDKRVAQFKEWQALTERATTNDSPSLTEVGEVTESASATTDAVPFDGSTTTDQPSASAVSQTSTRRRSKRSAAATGELSASSAT